MNRRILPTLACAVVLVTGWTVLAFACEDKATTAQATTAKNAGARAADASVCTAEMAAKCTPAQAAACKKNGAKATAVTASGGVRDCCAKASATTAAKADECVGHKNAKAASAAGECAAHKSAKAASAKGDCGGAAMAGFSSRADAVFAGGPGCSHDGSNTMTQKRGQHGCDACADMAQYDDEIRSAGGLTQVVRLKNGVMFVHTADSPAHARAVQAAMTRRSDRLVALTSAGDRAKLCPDCKSMRGAMASGKLTREIVTIEGGCLTLMTSSDRSMVAKLHALAGNEMARKS